MSRECEGCSRPVWSRRGLWRGKLYCTPCLAAAFELAEILRGPAPYDDAERVSPEDRWLVFERALGRR